MRKYIVLLLVIAFTVCKANAQNSISGKIYTNDNKPAALVNVSITNNKLTTVTDEAGYFQFSNLPNGNYTIEVSYSGLITQQKAISVLETSNNVNFVLQENAKQLDAVIVTFKKGLNKEPVSIGKVAINPLDLPQSIATINQNVMKEQQAQRLSDVIRNVNGVYLGTTRGNVQESFYARGYSFGSNNMFKNGARVNSGVMPEISSLEKVEILKGSAAILFGNVAPGGVLNMVTKQPKFNRGAEISLRAGSYGLIKPSVDVYGPITKSIAFRVNGTYEKANSFRDVVNSERSYINPSFLFKLSPKTELLVQGDYLKTNFTPDFGIGSINNLIIPNVSRSAFFGTSWQYNKVQQSSASATIKHKLSNNWSLNASTTFQQFKRDYYSTERIQALANGDWTRPLNKIDSKEDYILGGVDVTGKFKTGKIEHTLLTGIDADNYYTTTFAFNNPTTYDKINILDSKKFVGRTDIPAATKITKVETPVTRYGAYVQDLISLSTKFKLLAGVRWSKQESRAATTTYLIKDSTAKTVAKNDAAFSPRLGLVYKPKENISAFASYANSFVVNSGTDIFGAALSPSIVDQYEIGVKNDLIKGRLSVNLTLYKIINNNLAQTAQFDASGRENNNTNIKELTGQTTSDGVEVDVQSEPIMGLNIMAGYSYNNMRYTKVKQGKGNYIEGERLVNTPANTVNTSVFYTFKQSKLKGLKVGGSAVYIGNRFGGWNNTQQQTQAYNRLISVKGFTTVDLTAGYSFKQFSLLAKVSNLFNVYNYYVHENYSVNPIAPRQFVSTLAVKL